MASAGLYASLHLLPDNDANIPPTTQFFTGRMPFLPPNQQRQSTEGMKKVSNEAEWRSGSREFQNDGIATKKYMKQNRKRPLLLKTARQTISDVIWLVYNRKVSRCLWVFCLTAKKINLVVDSLFNRQPMKWAEFTDHWASSTVLASKFHMHCSLLKSQVEIPFVTSGVLSKWLNISSRKQCHTTA